MHIFLVYGNIKRKIPQTTESFATVDQKQLQNCASSRGLSYSAGDCDRMSMVLLPCFEQHIILNRSFTDRIFCTVPIESFNFSIILVVEIELN